MKKIIKLTESDLIRLVKKVIKETNNAEVEEGMFSRLFNRPSVDDAAHDQKRGMGYSHRGKEEDEKQYIVFNGDKYYEDEIEYADYNDMGEIPRLENGKLIIANPMWNN